MSRHRTTATFLFVLLAAWAFAGTASAAVPRLIFPILAATTYTDDFGAPRPSGGHQANDIMAAKRSPVVAVEAGRVVKYTRSSNAGCMLYLYGKSGTTYMYIHLNNDRTLRNDNRGGCKNRIAYAPGLAKRQWVRAGQLIGYVGDSGDANGIASHLHFELHPNGGRAVSPYSRLRRAYKDLYPRPAEDAFRTMSLRVFGRVVGTVLDADPQRLRLHVTRVVMVQNGWQIRPARSLTVSVPDGAVVRHAVAPGSFEQITLASLRPRDRIVVRTNSFHDTLAAARARSNAHTIREVLLRLDT